MQRANSCLSFTFSTLSQRSSRFARLHHGHAQMSWQHFNLVYHNQDGIALSRYVPRLPRDGPPARLLLRRWLPEWYHDRSIITHNTVRDNRENSILVSLFSKSNDCRLLVRTTVVESYLPLDFFTIWSFEHSAQVVRNHQVRGLQTASQAGQETKSRTQPK
jgi:hypothetical protein